MLIDLIILRFNLKKYDQIMCLFFILIYFVSLQFSSLYYFILFFTLSYSLDISLYIHEYYKKFVFSYFGKNGLFR